MMSNGYLSRRTLQMCCILSCVNAKKKKKHAPLLFYCLFSCLKPIYVICCRERRQRLLCSTQKRASLGFLLSSPMYITAHLRCLKSPLSINSSSLRFFPFSPSSHSQLYCLTPAASILTSFLYRILGMLM